MKRKEEEKRQKKRIFIMSTASAVVLFLLGLWLIEPGPPSGIRMATGDPGGQYAYFGKIYQSELARMGLKVELVETSGAIENLELLTKGEVDIAFSQGGVAELVDDPEGVLRGLASIYWEPLWLFYRSDQPIKRITSLRGAVISAGPKNSGTDAVVRQILSANGINDSNTRIVNYGMSDAATALTMPKTQDADDTAATVEPIRAAFFITSYRNKTIQLLLTHPDIHILNFQRYRAYARQLPYIAPLELVEGVLNLERNIPHNDITLLSPAALIAANAGVHPQVVEKVLKVAKNAHSRGSLLAKPGTFPSTEHVDLPLDEAAVTYLESGESFLSQFMPYGVIRVLYRLKLILLPMIVLIIPLGRIFPALYNFHNNNLIKKHYAILRDIEDEIDDASTSEDIQAGITKLKNLENDLEETSLKIPGHLQGGIYDWRFHVKMVVEEAEKKLNSLL